MVELRARPVKDRHEVVADAADARLCQAADVLTVVLDVPLARGLAELDDLVHGHALDHLEEKARVLHLLFQRRNALAAPHLARRHVVHRGDDRLHARNLPDILERHLVVAAVPSK